ncbi:GAF domain-containing protein [Aliiruegeria lutimaris]|uniref:GAF domain-containing protein n=1 Tax=Aliiruegeria lutimaris TaxID=571298 RepID=A0A1G9EGP6_9RHOB|nr:GAF domain-containing protein [Aliiruegeria lutimaris]SDK75320.1 hypothetical protein SAMN04488026_105224 [Aliiruegeria lutimaris]
MSDAQLLSFAAHGNGPCFVRVTEVWVLDETGTRLVLKDGLYGDLENFAKVSGNESFAFGEGLPGKAWAEARPVVLKGFQGSYFKRTEAAEAAGLTAGIALPVFAGEDLKGVVTFFFGDDAEHVGAVEVWASAGERSDPLKLEDGYFGTAEHFGWISRHTEFPHGQGLPGQAWASGRAVLFEDLGASHKFLRAESAAKAGMTAGLGLPISAPNPAPHVVTLLSALDTPIARRFEIWEGSAGAGFIRIAGADEHGNPLPEQQDVSRFETGAGVLGTVAATAIPAAVEMTSSAGSAVVALPILSDGKVVQIAAWYF